MKEAVLSIQITKQKEFILFAYKKSIQRPSMTAECLNI